MVVPPRDPWYNRYAGYYRRPYTGCGCLYGILIVILIWFALSLFIDALVVY